MDESQVSTATLQAAETTGPAEDPATTSATIQSKTEVDLIDVCAATKKASSKDNHTSTHVEEVQQTRWWVQLSIGGYGILAPSTRAHHVP